MMLIGELAKQTGLSRDTIRFYEKRGLIPAGIQDNPYNTYKRYPEETMEKLLVIKRIKGFGFTLKEVADFLALLDVNAATCHNVAEKFTTKIKLIDANIRALSDLKQQLMEGIQACSAKEEDLETCPLIKVEA